LRETDLFLIKESGRRTVQELKRLQGRILEENPHLLSHYYQQEVKLGGRGCKWYFLGSA